MAAGLAACLAAAGAMLGAHGTAAQRLDISAGSVWLPSTSEGLLTLLDGAAGEAVGSVRVAEKGAPLATAQQGSTAYAADLAHGTVVRVDGATYQRSDAVALFGGGRSDQLRVYATGDAFIAVDGERARAARTDPETLRLLEEPVTLPVRPRADQAVVDPSGRLWMVGGGDGDLVRLQVGRSGAWQQDTWARGTTGDAQLLLLHDSPAIADSGSVSAVSQSGDADPQACRLGLAPGEAPVFAGSPVSSRLYVAVPPAGFCSPAT